MRAILASLSFLFFTACAGYKTAQPYQHFQELVATENDKRPWVADTEEFWLRLDDCASVRKPALRNACIAGLTEWSRGKMHSIHVLAVPANALDLYHAKKDEYLSQFAAKMEKQVEHRFTSRSPRKFFADAFHDAILYEGQVRELHEQNRTQALYNEHVNKVDEYNAAIERRNAAMLAIAQGLATIGAQIQQQREIDRLQQQNYNLQQQQYRQNCRQLQQNARGVKPICF